MDLNDKNKDWFRKDFFYWDFVNNALLTYTGYSNYCILVINFRVKYNIQILNIKDNFISLIITLGNFLVDFF